MSLSLCNRALTPLQRRSIQVCGACVALLAFVERIWFDQAKHNPTLWTIAMFSVLIALPAAAVLFTGFRYMARETDEFVRTLVAHSLLWSLGIILVVDPVLGISLHSDNGMRILPILNLDLFCVITPIALRIQLWRSR